jgi:hypothetical protein
MGESVMTTLQERQERVARGSRRKRDLQAVAPPFDYPAFAAEHFPDEHPLLVRAATWQVHASRHLHQDPTPEEVRTRLEAMGWTREQWTGVAP